MLLTLLIKREDQVIIDRSGSKLTVKKLLVNTILGLEQFNDQIPEFTVTDINIRVIGTIFSHSIRLADPLRKAMLQAINVHHAKEDITFDCYAFANLVGDRKHHPVRYLLKHWRLIPKPWFISNGAVLIFQSGRNRFRHAAVYLGKGLYISIYGAGGDLEISTLKQIKKDFKADRVYLARPRKVLPTET